MYKWNLNYRVQLCNLSLQSEGALTFTAEIVNLWQQWHDEWNIYNSVILLAVPPPHSLKSTIHHAETSRHVLVTCSWHVSDHTWRGSAPFYNCWEGCLLRNLFDAGLHCEFSCRGISITQVGFHHCKSWPRAWINMAWYYTVVCVMTQPDPHSQIFFCYLFYVSLHASCLVFRWLLYYDTYMY